jgi:hypothetical protein
MYGCYVFESGHGTRFADPGTLACRRLISPPQYPAAVRYSELLPTLERFWLRNLVLLAVSTPWNKRQARNFLS